MPVNLLCKIAENFHRKNLELPREVLRKDFGSFVSSKNRAAERRRERKERKRKRESNFASKLAGAPVDKPPLLWNMSRCGDLR